MKRWSMMMVAVVVAALLAAGCGAGGDAAAEQKEGSARGGPVGQADATACSANRRAISTAAQSYFYGEGAYPTSIQALAPGYLQSVPACPSGGSYTLQGSEVTCSIHGR